MNTMKNKLNRLYKKAYNFIKKHKKQELIALLACAFFATIVITAPAIAASLPCEIKVNNKTVCYVKNENVAQDAIRETYKATLPDKAKLLKYSSNVKISYNKANIFSALSNISSKKNAVKSIDKSYKDKDGKNPEIEATYIATHREVYIPEPKYVKNDKMLAGREKVKKEGITGSMDVSTVYVSVNGKVKSKEDINNRIIEKGKKAVIYRGTLGLPDGEDWETYKGDPIYKNGEELIKTAYNYIGAPYKHGGTSLKHGVSCVGFVRAIYMKYGIKIGNSHRAMETAGIGVSYKNARKGDIICYRGHVGIYIGNGKMLDATSRRGVGVNKVHPKSIIAVRRIVK